jgi:hypothetical protein
LLLEEGYAFFTEHALEQPQSVDKALALLKARQSACCAHFIFSELAAGCVHQGGHQSQLQPGAFAHRPHASWDLCQTQVVRNDNQTYAGATLVYEDGRDRDMNDWVVEGVRSVAFYSRLVNGAQNPEVTSAYTWRATVVHARPALAGTQFTDDWVWVIGANAARVGDANISSSSSSSVSSPWSPCPSSSGGEHQYLEDTNGFDSVFTVHHASTANVAHEAPRVHVVGGEDARPWFIPLIDDVRSVISPSGRSYFWIRALQSVGGNGQVVAEHREPRFALIVRDCSDWVVDHTLRMAPGQVWSPPSEGEPVCLPDNAAQCRGGDRSGAPCTNAVEQCPWGACVGTGVCLWRNGTVSQSGTARYQCQLEADQCPYGVCYGMNKEERGAHPNLCENHDDNNSAK